MKTNHVKQKLLDGGRSIGTFVFEFNTTGIGRLAANAGAEFIVYGDDDGHQRDSARKNPGHGISLCGSHAGCRGHGNHDPDV
jgi:hypothetical protein